MLLSGFVLRLESRSYSDLLAQFGFNGDDSYKGRRDELFRSLNSNPLAPFVTRGVQFGSEPLFDDVLPIETMISEVNAAKQQLKPLGIPITVSELAFGKSEHNVGHDHR
jgi:hypothetical protein